MFMCFLDVLENVIVFYVGNVITCVEKYKDIIHILRISQEAHVHKEVTNNKFFYYFQHSSNKMEVAAAVCPTNTPSYPSSGVMSSSSDSGNSSANSSVSSSSSISATSRLQNSSRMNSSSSKINNTNHRQQAAAPATPNRHVNFGGGTGEEKKREKFLTAKYGAHQMALIRKRLRVEMWMYERLQELYGAVSIDS